MTSAIRSSVFVGTSLDGFIARPNGDFDFLKPWEGQEHGYRAFMATVDTIVMGRNTYEKVLTLDDWPYGGTPVVVLTSRPLDVPAGRTWIVEHMGGSPKDIVSRLAARGATHLYVDGGITVQRFLREGLIERLIITRVPVLIGTGIPLFGAVPSDIRLTHVATREYPSGMVQSEYTVAT